MCARVSRGRGVKGELVGLVSSVLSARAFLVRLIYQAPTTKHGSGKYYG